MCVRIFGGCGGGEREPALGVGNRDVRVTLSFKTRDKANDT